MAATTTSFGQEEAAAMVAELKKTFATGKTRSYEWRVAQLKCLMKLVDEREGEIVEALRSDLNKPEFESVLSEITMLKSSCKRAIKGLKQWMKPEKVKTPLLSFPSSAEIVAEPLGVVLVISAWNYPIFAALHSPFLSFFPSLSSDLKKFSSVYVCFSPLLSLDPVVGAIAAGNAVVLKPSEISPVTSSLLAKSIVQYMDTSAVRVVEGAVPETSALLEQKWDKIFYTGNGKVARIVMTAAAKHLTPVTLELGGKSPVIVDSDVNLKIAVKRVIVGKWGSNNGQACISPDYIITTKGFAPKLVDTLKQELERFYGIEPLKSNDLSRVVNSNHFDRLMKLLDEDKVVGKVVYGGQSDKSELKIAPTLLLDVPEDSLIMNEEIFGPLLPIITVDNLEDSFDIIAKKPKPLAAYLFTNRGSLKDKFVKTVSAGGLLINDTVLHLAVPTLPFGGVGESGMGSYHGKFSFDGFSHKKAVLYRSFVGDAPVRYPPYTKANMRLLGALMGGSMLCILQAMIASLFSSSGKPKKA